MPVHFGIDIELGIDSPFFCVKATPLLRLVGPRFILGLAPVSRLPRVSAGSALPQSKHRHGASAVAVAVSANAAARQLVRDVVVVAPDDFWYVLDRPRSTRIECPVHFPRNLADNSSPDLNALLDLSVADAATPDDFMPDPSLFASNTVLSTLAVYDVAEMDHHVPPQPLATVSPSDLWRDAPLSVPPSAVLTNLTSPSNFDSPDLADSFETSPTFNGEVDPAADHWYSLFPDPMGERDESPMHPADDVLESTHVGLTDALTQPRSSHLESPQPARATFAKHSSVSGVSARKRDKPLPPIHVEEFMDPVTVKRARNTLAARKSRQRKTERFEELERTIEDLRGEVVHWKSLALARHSGRNP